MPVVLGQGHLDCRMAALTTGWLQLGGGDEKGTSRQRGAGWLQCDSSVRREGSGTLTVGQWCRNNGMRTAVIG